MYTHPEIHSRLAPQRQADLRREFGHGRRRPRRAPDSPFDGLGPLVRAAQAGDDRSWELLVARLTPPLRRIVRAYGLSPADVDDVVQASWMTAFMHIGRLRNADAFGGWLTVTARRASLRLLDRGSREFATDNEHVLDQATYSTPESAVLEAEELEAVHAAVDRLPDRQRGIVRALLRHSGTSYDDIAVELDIPVGSIGPTRERAFARLRRDRRLVATI
jgi:RNA polymerase sigma factor (sigma-70 family)